MKTFKFLMPFLLVAFALVGCDTDDLRNDIDELKNRVESLEAQVSAINGNMNALQILVEGNKTIKNIAFENGVYTLTLSNDDVITLTQGEDAVANTPDITISDDNKWVINGKPTGVSATGNNAAVPSFRIFEENGKSYWQVDLDGEGTVCDYDYVYDSKNQKVEAITGGGQQSGDTFFKEVKIDGDLLRVVLSADESKTYYLPIKQDLTCSIITEGLEDYDENDKVLTVGYGLEAKIPVKIQGDKYFVTAPSGWVALLEAPDAEGNSEIILKAPAKSSATFGTRAATADNTVDLTLQVNKGAYWAIEKIKVEAIEIISSYYELFNNGEVINIAGLELKKSDWESVDNFTIKTIGSAGNGTDDNKIDGNGIYFVQPGAVAVYASSGDVTNMYIVRDNSNDNTAKLQVDGHFHLKGDNTSRFLCEGLTFDFSHKNIYAFNLYADFGELIFNNCIIKPYTGQPIFYTGNAYSLKSIVFENCKIDVTGRTQRQLFNIQKVGVESIILKNNVLYSTGDADVTVQFFNIGNADTSPTLSNFTMENNTLYNAVPGTYGIVTCKGYGTISIKNNLLYSSDYAAYNILLRFYNDGVEKTSGSGETVFNFANKGTKAWKIFNQNDVLEGSTQVNYSIENMFVSMDKENGIFIPKDELKAYGAQFE